MLSYSYKISYLKKKFDEDKMYIKSSFCLYSVILRLMGILFLKNNFTDCPLSSAPDYVRINPI